MISIGISSGASPSGPGARPRCASPPTASGSPLATALLREFDGPEATLRGDRQHFTHSLEWKVDKLGIFEMRRHYTNYFRGRPHFKPLRMKLVQSEDIQEIYDTLDEIAHTMAYEEA